MKKFILFLMASLLFVYPVLSNNSLNDSTHFIYVSINGNDNTTNGSKIQPFRNIQTAINYSSNGDIVLVLEGRYYGPDNRNLVFKGKSITVQSEFPDDNTCLNNTIIDAEGIGFVIRFINNEGSNSVFQGFSIILGDTSLIPIKGIPGFIELSKKANPTTRRLKIISDNLKDLKKLQRKSEQNIFKSTTSNSDETSLNNPYTQPINTTDYYGSGDVDKDGQLTDNDLQKVDSIINGYISPNIRADVNGNGMIDNNDFSLIDSAINYNKILSAWWNQLTTENEKNKWIDSIIKIDKTDELTYILGTFQCHHFAKQINYNAFQKFTYSSDIFDGSQTVYNLPIFYVGIWGENFSPGHAINTILIKNNPLDFYNWRFIESQTDYNVSPGMWDMPYNTYVSIEDENNNTKLSFFVDEDGWRIESVDSTFLNNQPNLKDNNNYPYCYNPRIVPNDSDFIIFEKQRDNLTRIMDLHLLKNDVYSNYPITYFNHFSRLYDIKNLGNNHYCLLWSSKTDENISGIYTGILYLDSLKLYDIDLVYSYNDNGIVNTAKLLIDSNNKIYAFWYKPAGGGLLYSYKNSGIWSSPEIITNYEYIYPYETKKVFDVIQYEDSLLFAFFINGYGESIHGIKYVDSWQEPFTLLNGEGFREVSSCIDNSGKVYLVYNIHGNFSLNKLYYIFSEDMQNWSSPKQIDSGTDIYNPKILSNNRGELILVYEKLYNNQIVPVWRKYSSNTWSQPHYIPVREGADASYTDSYLTSKNQLQLAWASQAMDSLKIESFLVEDLSNPETGVELTNFLKSDYFKIYPNPALNKVIIESEVVITGKISISVFDLSGSILLNNELYVNNQELHYNLDLSKFNSGIYFIKLQNKDYSQINKLVLE